MTPTVHHGRSIPRGRGARLVSRRRRRHAGLARSLHTVHDAGAYTGGKPCDQAGSRLCSRDQFVAIFATPDYGGVVTESLNARVRRVLESAGENQGEFARRLGMSADKLSKSLNGTRRFTSLELALIAELGHTTVDWLLNGTVPHEGLSSMAARTKPSTSASCEDGREEALRHAEMIDALATAGYTVSRPSLPKPPQSGSLLEQGTRLAEAAQAVIGTSPCGMPVRALAELWEQRFGLVAAATTLPDGLDGLAWDSGTFRLILVGRTDGWTRQRFTLAHELGHILAGDAADKPLAEHIAPSLDRGQAEIRANAFAAELLMPSKELMARSGDAAVTDRSAFLSLAWNFQVSPSAMATRLRTLGIITDEQRRQWSGATTRIAADHCGDAEGHMQHAQQAGDGWYSASLAKLAIAAYAKGDISIRPVAAVTGLRPERLLDLFHPQAGPEEAPVPPPVATSSPELAFHP